MKALIINYNRLTLTAALANWCAANGLDPVFIDNGSDYPLLIEYYASLSPYPVVRLDGNYGHKAPWLPQLGILDKLVGGEQYIVTDPDLDLEGVPSDFLAVLARGLVQYPWCDKVGLSLEISDLPDIPAANYVRYKCEARYWTRPLGDMYYDAPVDTTFALYRAGVRAYSVNGIRTRRPYTCKHVPWYYKDVKELPEDEQYYFTTANASSSGKNRLIK
jgi:hypothetical protein